MDHAETCELDVNGSRRCEQIDAALTQRRSWSVRKVADGGWTYFLGGKDAIKIGYSKNLGIRLAQLQAATPDKLKPLLMVPTERLSEPAAHAMFGHLRLQGEWFRPEPAGSVTSAYPRI
jgi:hypothetical protein